MVTKDLTPAVAYVRMSSDKQEASPEQQRDEIAKLAAKHKCRIVREYFDEGISGDSTAKRKAFQRMIRDAEEKGDFACIICWDQDRFGRFDSIEAGRWIHPLREAGVWLLTVAQGQIDWNDFTGRMMYAIQQEGKHQFLVDLSRNVLRGKLAAAKKGEGANNPPYGMDRGLYDEHGQLKQRVPYGQKIAKPHGWSVRFLVSEDAQAVEVVRWLFKQSDETDCGAGWLAGDLNRRGIPSPKGKAWSIQAIYGILTNRFYTGAHVFGRKRYGKYHHTDDNGDVAKGSSRSKGKPIIVEGIHETLIEKATFDRVQQKLGERAITGRRPRSNSYILSGVLRCGHCGGPLVGRGCRNEKMPRYYICLNGTTRPGSCRRYQIQQKAIESYITRLIEARLFQPDAIEAIERAIYRRAKAKPSFKGRAGELKGQIATLDRKITKGNENLLLADPAHVPDLSRLLGQWKEDRAKIQGELEALAHNPSGQTAEEAAKRAVGELRRLRKHFEAADPMKRKSVIRAIVGDITLWWQPFGKRNQRFARGELTLRSDLAIYSTGFRGR